MSKINLEGHVIINWNGVTLHLETKPVPHIKVLQSTSTVCLTSHVEEQELGICFPSQRRSDDGIHTISSDEITLFKASVKSSSPEAEMAMKLQTTSMKKGYEDENISTTGDVSFITNPKALTRLTILSNHALDFGVCSKRGKTDHLLIDLDVDDTKEEK